MPGAISHHHHLLHPLWNESCHTDTCAGSRAWGDNIAAVIATINPVTPFLTTTSF